MDQFRTESSTLNPTDRSDGEIIALVKAGNSDEFRYLVRRYENQIYSMVRRQVADEAIAKELTQDVFVRAFTGLAGFAGRSLFLTWLTRIALNVCHSYFSSRRFKEWSRTVPLEAHPELPSEREEQSAPYTAQEVAALRQAIAALKPRFRDVVVLCGIESKTYAEAAEILAIPYGTVCSRLNTAHHLLRKNLKRVNQ